MIRVEINESKDGITKIIVKGHAGSGPYGHDLCCAAVSAVLFGGWNALEENGPYHYEAEKEGEALLEVTGKTSSKDKTVLDTIRTQLESISKSYPKNIEIKLKKE